MVGIQFPQAARQQWHATFLAVLRDSAETLASCSRRIAAWKRPIRLTRPTMMVTDELTMRSTMRRTMNPPGKMRLWNHLPTTSPWKVTRMAKWPKLWRLSCSSSRRAMARERERVRAPLALPPSLFPFKSADGISNLLTASPLTPRQKRLRNNAVKFLKQVTTTCTSCHFHWVGKDARSKQEGGQDLCAFSQEEVRWQDNDVFLFFMIDLSPMMSAMLASALPFLTPMPLL